MTARDYILFCAILGAGVLHAVAAAPVPSTPATTLTAFSKALEEGDSAALSPLVTGDAKEKAWVVAYAAQLRAFHDLELALTKRFGKDYTDSDTGKEIREQIETGRDEELLADLKKAKLGKPDGDSVLIILDESASDDRQGRLLKEEGKWKVDLVSLSNYFSVDDTPGLKAMADAAGGLARDVGAGKFASLEEAGKAMEERLEEASAVGAKKPVETPAGKTRRP